MPDSAADSLQCIMKHLVSVNLTQMVFHVNMRHTVYTIDYNSIQYTVYMFGIVWVTMHVHGTMSYFKHALVRSAILRNDRWHPWPFFRRLFDAAVSTLALLLRSEDVRPCFIDCVTDFI